jgi:tetratricopeptide (TPR) repeat protein
MTLTQLGLLYDAMGRLEEAVAWHRQALDIDVLLSDTFNEGKDRNNLAGTLIALRRYDEARAEIERAIACKEPYGHAAQPWTTWNVLHDLERAAGDEAAAGRARGEARRLYLAYRREGGENQSGGGRLCAAFARAVQAGQRAEMTALLPQLAADPRASESLKALISALQAILAGSRDPALAEDPALNYEFAAEVQLSLEGLGEDRGRGSGWTNR